MFQFFFAAPIAELLDEDAAAFEFLFGIPHSTFVGGGCPPDAAAWGRARQFAGLRRGLPASGPAPPPQPSPNDVIGRIYAEH